MSENSETSLYCRCTRPSSSREEDSLEGSLQYLAAAGLIAFGPKTRAKRFSTFCKIDFASVGAEARLREALLARQSG
jgi:hypothetical protein